MRVLVTGGTGFVGPKVVHALRAARTSGVRLVRDRRSAGPRWGRAVEGDMTDAGSLRRAVEGRDAVVHLVAIRQGKPERVRARHDERDARPRSRPRATRACAASC